MAKGKIVNMSAKDKAALNAAIVQLCQVESKSTSEILESPTVVEMQSKYNSHVVRQHLKALVRVGLLQSRGETHVLYHATDFGKRSLTDFNSRETG